MKKIIAMGAAAALVGGLVFAGDPVANVSKVSFGGNAEVKWGVDLDAGKTGFANSTDATFKVKLFDAGDIATSGEGVWADIQIKVDSKETEAKNGADNVPVVIKGATVDHAKIHFGDAYVGIRAGETVANGYNIGAAAIAAEKTSVAKKGPDKFTQGIVAGYANDLFGINVDFRSLKDDSTQYTNAYSIAANGELKAVENLSVKAGVAYNLSDKYYTNVAANSAVKENELATAPYKNGHVLGYSAYADYKIAIDDTYYVKPMVAFAGSNTTAKSAADKDYSSNENTLAAGVMFGWGATDDNNAGVPFLDVDAAKKVTPGVSVVAEMPLSTVTKDNDVTTTTHAGTIVKIMPSVYTGDIVPNLKAGAYAEMFVLNAYKEKTIEPSSDGKTEERWTVQKKDTNMPLAIAAGASYDIKADDITCTVKAGVRYANGSYVTDNKAACSSQSGIFDNMGKQKATDKGLDQDYLNLKAGVSVSGLLNNTVFSLDYASANLLNANEYTEAKGYKYGAYNVKAGTLNVGCKISL